jgi:flagellar assembly protein FliH
LSNLFKPWAIKSEASDARVINSDAILDTVLEKGKAREAEMAQSKAAQEVISSVLETALSDMGASDGDIEGSEAVFEAGLETAGTYTEEELTRMSGTDERNLSEHGMGSEMMQPDGAPAPDREVAATSEAADKMLSDAAAKADELITQAKESAAQIENEARQRGYDEGVEKLNREKEEAENRYRESYDAKVRNLEAEYEAKKGNMERELVDTITEVYNRVFKIQFDNKKQLLMYLIDNALAGTDGDKSFRLKVSEDNVLFLENHSEDILDKIGHDVELEILPDATLGENDCVIETESGIIDCSLGAQLDNLTRDLRSLCSAS